MVGKIGKMMPSWFTYAKVRASFAQVGNDMDAYQLYNYYEISSDPNGNTTGKPLETYYDSTVRSELISSWEAGVELKFFNYAFQKITYLFIFGASKLLKNSPPVKSR